MYDYYEQYYDSYIYKRVKVEDGDTVDIKKNSICIQTNVNMEYDTELYHRQHYKSNSYVSWLEPVKDPIKIIKDPPDMSFEKLVGVSENDIIIPEKKWWKFW